MSTPEFEDVAQEAESIAQSGENVRERIRGLLIQTVRDRKLSFKEVRMLVEETLSGAVSTIEKSVSGDTPLVKQVYDGLEDGLATTATATKLALEEAQSRGKSFADEELSETVQDLKVLEEMFFKTVSSIGGQFTTTVRNQLNDFVTHGKRTGSQIRPAAEKAIAVATKKPISFAAESASAGTEVTRQAAGMLLQAMSGILQAGGELLEGSSNKDDEPST